MKKILLAALLAVAACPPPAYSQKPVAAAATLNERDGKTLGDIMAMNTYAMMLMKMAAQKALAEELRTSAMTMVEDHQRLDAQLTAYANRYNLSMDADRREKYTDKINKWDSDPVGTGWDRDMVEELVDVHKDGIGMLEAAAASIEDDELKSLINGSLPAMKEHLDRLLPLKGAVKAGNTVNAATPAIARTHVAADLPPGNEKDAKFLSDLRLMNTYELQLMELILKKGNHRALRDAAQHMIEDHQKLDEKSMAYARAHKYGNDPDEASKANEKANKWRQKKGGMEWDADLIEELIDIHKDGIDMLEDAVTDVKDDELRTMMRDALPAMKMHLEMLEPLKETVKKPWKGK